MPTTTPPTTATRIIAGHRLTLTRGRRYLATRPPVYREMRTCDVTIRDITEGIDGPAVDIVTALRRHQADLLIMTFNHGPVSFGGRVWL